MNRWTLLKHEINNQDNIDIHYDFLIENGKDCLTWKMSIIPEINGCSVDIWDHFNHRLIWLSRESHLLTRNRGFVKRIDYGTFRLIGTILDKNKFSIVLQGEIMNGIFNKNGNSCKLVSLN
tara:strand:+ start:2453 stop:2815 length:363 start_codon:yes stop_codon:yes gene_type:complete